MYAFTAFKWGPAWVEQTCFSEEKKKKQPTKRNCKNNLITQAEQCASVHTGVKTPAVLEIHRYF